MIFLKKSHLNTIVLYENVYYSAIQSFSGSNTIILRIIFFLFLLPDGKNLPYIY